MLAELPPVMPRGSTPAMAGAITLRVGELYPGLLFQGLGVSAITPGLDVGLPNADQALHCILHAEKFNCLPPNRKGPALDQALPLGDRTLKN